MKCRLALESIAVRYAASEACGVQLDSRARSFCDVRQLLIRLGIGIPRRSRISF